MAAKLVGPSMAVQLSRKILADVSEVPVTFIPEATLNLQIKQDLTCALVADFEGAKARRGCTGQAAPSRK